MNSNFIEIISIEWTNLTQPLATIRNEHYCVYKVYVYFNIHPFLVDKKEYAQLDFACTVAHDID